MSAPSTSTRSRSGRIGSREELKAALEALIFMSDEPIPLSEMVQVLGEPEDSVRAALDALRSDYATSGRGLRIEEVGGGVRFTTRPEVAPFLVRLSKLRHKRRLSHAALETLAIVAYRQPITAPEIQEIRGVNPDGALKTLLDKSLLRISGRKKVVGRPLLYATTKEFLIHFGLNTLKDLPPMEEFERMIAAAEPDPDPEPEVEPAAAQAGAAAAKDGDHGDERNERDDEVVSGDDAETDDEEDDA